MHLWSLQTPNHDLTSGRVDHTKSEYYNRVPTAKEAYNELWKRLEMPDGQIVWCYTDNPKIAKNGNEMIMWELDVPRDSIICFLKSEDWDRILHGNQIVPTKTMNHQWLAQGVAEDCDDLPAYVEQKKQDFCSRKPDTGSWWDCLFVDGPGASISAIIDHPVPDRFIKRKITCWC